MLQQKLRGIFLKKKKKILIRKLKVSDKVDNNSKTIGKAINDYVNLVDTAIKEYFSESENPFMAMGNVRKRVLSGVNNNIIII